jgi:hypothetical protein
MTMQKLNLGLKSSPAPMKDGDFIPAEYFLNVGYIDEDQDDGTEMFIGLAKGIPMRAADLKEPKGSSKKYRDMLQSKNGLLQKFLTKGEDMEPGEECIVGTTDNGLVLQLKRVRSDDEPVAADNPYMTRLASITLA